MTQQPERRGWLNPTVIGAGLTSFFADVCYEMAAAILPGFLQVLRLPAALLTGLIEGSADAASSFAKLLSGWYGDRLGRRKPFVLLGYGLTAVSQPIIAFAAGWPLIWFAKVLGWLGKGTRGPLRNAILADAVAPEDRGKAFGLHRAGDTLGAIVGPLIGFALLRSAPSDLFAGETGSYRFVFLVTLIPGLASVLTFALFIREQRAAAQPERRLWASLRSLPRSFRRWLVGVGVFSLGDCSDKLLVIAAVKLLMPALGERDAISIGVLLYAVRNVSQTLTAFPIGVLSDRIGPRRPLVAGYALGAVVMTGFAAQPGTQAALFLLFALAGLYLAVEESLEAVLTADLVPDRTLRGTAYGLMGTVNGLGKLASSVTVGLLIEQVSISAGFIYAAVMMLLGTLLIARVR